MAEDEDRQEVWFTPDRTRFYLVPKGLALPRGDQLIRGPTGLRRKRVDLDGMSAWEVPKAEALAQIDRQVGNATGRIRDLLGRVVEKGHEITGTTSATSGFDEIPSLDPKSVVGVTAGEVVGDADGARRALSGLLDRAAGTAERIGAGDRTAVRQRLHELEHDLLDEALPKIGGELSRFVRSIRKVGSNEPTDE